MRPETFETKYLPGLPPAEGGCPPVQHRISQADGMLIEYDAAVPMRDGVEIYCDVFRPEGDGQVPVIVAWGPYGKHGPVKYAIFPNHGVVSAWVSEYAGFEAPDPVYWTRNGYAVINVDPRGTWNSQGDATFYSAQEALDIYDLIEWAGTQPWSNGKVGMSGVSYLAIVQWRAAAERPPPGRDQPMGRGQRSLPRDGVPRWDSGEPLRSHVAVEASAVLQSASRGHGHDVCRASIVGCLLGEQDTGPEQGRGARLRRRELV